MNLGAVQYVPPARIKERKKKMTTYYSKVVTFLSGGNTIVLKNDAEFIEFSKLMLSIGIDANRAIRACVYTYPAMVEFNNGKGFALWSPEDQCKSEEWFGMEPFCWDEIRTELA